MASLTPKFNFRKPAGSDPVNVETDINESMEKIDKLYGGKAQIKRINGSMRVPNAGLVPTDNWTQMPAGPFVGRDDLDVTVKAVAGDWIEVGMNGLWDAQNVDGYLDAAIKFSGISMSGTVNPMSTNVGQGILAWRGEPARHSPIGGSVLRQLSAGDIDASGNVTVITIARVPTSSAHRFIWGISDIPFFVFLINRGSNL